jgi:hypothetical protein
MRDLTTLQLPPIVLILHQQLSCINLLPMVQSENESSPPTDTCYFSQQDQQGGESLRRGVQYFFHLGIMMMMLREVGLFFFALSGHCVRRIMFRRSTARGKW